MLLQQCSQVVQVGRFSDLPGIGGSLFSVQPVRSGGSLQHEATAAATHNILAFSVSWYTEENASKHQKTFKKNRQSSHPSSRTAKFGAT